MAAPFPTPSGPERDAAFRHLPEAEPDGTAGQRRGDGVPDARRQGATSRRASPVRAVSLVLTAVGGLLIFRVDALVGGTALEALGVILAIVGIAGVLASRPVRASGRAGPPTRR
jgi:hypothetical protein